jgi:hypothetical protein
MVLIAVFEFMEKVRILKEKEKRSRIVITGSSDTAAVVEQKNQDNDEYKFQEYKEPEHKEPSDNIPSFHIDRTGDLNNQFPLDRSNILMVQNTVLQNNIAMDKCKAYKNKTTKIQCSAKIKSGFFCGKHQSTGIPIYNDNGELIKTSTR